MSYLPVTLVMDHEARPQALLPAAWQPGHARAVPAEEDPPQPAAGCGSASRQEAEIGVVIMTEWTGQPEYLLGAEDLLCTRCWTGTPCRHTQPVDAPPLEPERYQPHHLCVVCARTWAPLRHRWSWLGCESCRAVNARIGSAYGQQVRLPLGRHSIMNGAAVRLDRRDPAVRKAQAGRLAWIGRRWDALFDWRRAQAAVLQSTLLPPHCRTAPFVPIAVWEDHIHGSWMASCEAWLGCVGLQSYRQLHNEASYLYAIGILPAPESIPEPDWIPMPPEA